MSYQIWIGNEPFRLWFDARDRLQGGHELELEVTAARLSGHRYGIGGFIVDFERLTAGAGREPKEVFLQEAAAISGQWPGMSALGLTDEVVRCVSKLAVPALLPAIEVEPELGRTVALNPHCPGEVLAAVAGGKPDSSLDLLLARHPNTPLLVLEAIHERQRGFDAHELLRLEHRIAELKGAQI